MKPLRLTMRGFRSHLEETSIDFEGRNFIAIVGPTGAGKSSILDSISYALYAKTPREKRSSASLISTRAKKAAITYRFAIADRVYEINRTIPAASDDFMVEEGSGDRVVGSTAITEKVQDLLGLDFGGFASSVLLAQGQFDLFLKATTKERTLILKGIFRIERIDQLREAAMNRRKTIDSELDKIEGERRQIPPDAADQVKTAKSEVTALTRRIAQLEKALPEETALLEREKEARTDQDAAEKEVLALTQAVGKLPAIALLEELAERETTCAKQTKEATATFESCTKAAARAATELQKLEEKVGDPKELHEARAQALAMTKLAAAITAAADELKQAEASAVAAEGEVTTQAANEATATAAFEEARAREAELHRVHAAHGLRATLSKGEPCPVCEQPVATLPKTKKAGDLDKARAAVAQAEAELVRTRSTLQEAKTAVATQRERVRSVATAHDKAVAEVADIEKILRGIAGRAKDPLAEIDARLESLDEARRAREQALESRDKAQGALNGCSAVKQALDGERRRHAGALIELAVKLDVAPPSVEDSASSLMKKVGEMTDRAAQRGDELGARIEKASVLVGETAEVLAELRARAGVEDSFVASIAEAKRQEGIKQHVIDDLEKKLARASELDRLEKGLRMRRALFEQLATDLTDRHFVNFLLEDRRRLLSELASERLREMTNRYRFTDDGEFNVVDELEGDIERGVDTLSGGESFLASLGLALGLAETATRHGGRLQCFFLDEGFGSLDPESFDLGLDGIERIATSDRLIGLVSHVPALAARVEDKIVLAKDADGSSIVVAGAGR